MERLVCSILVVTIAPSMGAAAFVCSMSRCCSYWQRPATIHSLSQTIHIVDGIECREVPIELESLGTITVLEATARAQEDLVNAALGEHEISLLLNAGDPYGAVLWPAASAVAEYLLKDDSLFKLSILELGTGTGLVSLAVSRKGVARRVMATDYESVPLKLLEYADAHLNKKEEYGQSTPIETSLFDLCDVTTPLPQADLVVAADIMYEPKTGRCMARRAVEALRNGSRVVIGDSPGRAGRPAFLETLHEMGVFQPEFFETTGRTCLGPRHELICGKGSTSISTDDKPQELQVALLDLRPETAFDKS